MEIGKALLLADFLIVLLAGISFGLKLGLYALLGVVVNAGVIDNVIAGNVFISIGFVNEVSGNYRITWQKGMKRNTKFTREKRCEV